MEIKSGTWINVKGVEKSQTRTVSGGLGILRSLVIGGAVFSLLTVPLMFNIQATKYKSEVSSLTIKTKSIQSETLSKKGRINSILEKYFPNAVLIQIGGKRFFLKSK